MTLLKAGLAEAVMNGQWDTSYDVTLIVFLIFSAVYVIITMVISIVFVYYCGKLVFNYIKNKGIRKQKRLL